MRYATLPLLAGISLAAISCMDQTPVGPSLVLGVGTASVTTPGTGPWARVVNGETGPGSLYALYIPTNWNGDAIYFAHGDKVVLVAESNGIERRPDPVGVVDHIAVPFLS